MSAWFDGIVACGLPGHGVSSLSRLAGRDVTIDEFRPILERQLEAVFDLDLLPTPPPFATDRLVRA